MKPDKKCESSNVLTAKDIEESHAIVRANTNNKFQIRPEDAAAVKQLIESAGTFKPITKIYNRPIYPEYKHEKNGYFRINTYCDKCNREVDFDTFMCDKNYYCECCHELIKRCIITRISKRDFDKQFLLVSVPRFL